MTSEELEAKAKEIESFISGNGGTILKQLNPVAKTLSYPIKKRASGFMGVLEFQLEEDKLVELKETLAKDKKIVRFMAIIKRAAEFKKERRTRTKPVIAVEPEQKPEIKVEKIEEEEKPISKIKEIKEKVELKDIEHELDEILGE